MFLYRSGQLMQFWSQLSVVLARFLTMTDSSILFPVPVSIFCTVQTFFFVNFLPFSLFDLITSSLLNVFNGKSIRSSVRNFPNILPSQISTSDLYIIFFTPISFDACQAEVRPSSQLWAILKFDNRFTFGPSMITSTAWA